MTEINEEFLKEIREAIQENKEIQQIARNNLRKLRQMEQETIEIINKERRTTND